MPVRRDKRTGRWFFRKTVRIDDGKTLRLSGTPGIPGEYQEFPNSRAGAEAAEQRAIQRASLVRDDEAEKEVPTFKDWFHGRFWREWVVSRKNKPSEVKSKTRINKNRLEPRFGSMQLDEITVDKVAEFRASLVDEDLDEKTINNILAVLSKSLRYAEDCRLIDRAPKIGLFKVERPEIVTWEFEQYARILTSAKAEGDEWYAAVCLAGDQGLRVGEVRALRWREDVDMVAQTVTVNRQICSGETTTPKGRTRRTIPMTATTYEALRRMGTIREGLVVRGFDGEQKTDADTSHAIERICRRAGLPVRYWHALRHSFGTHAAMFGVNPWRLQTWLGHKRIDETMLYVHVAESHARKLPELVRDAADGIEDADDRIIAMLGARSKVTASNVAWRGSLVAAASSETA